MRILRYSMYTEDYHSNDKNITNNIIINIETKRLQQRQFNITPKYPISYLYVVRSLNL